MINAQNRNGPIFYLPGHQWRGRKRVNEKRNQEGSSNNNFKGGRIIREGYILIRVEGHPRASKKGSYVREHIILMEQYLGRYLEPDECVHHIDGNKQNNVISNLKLMKSGKHSSHHRLKEFSEGKSLFGRE